MQSWIRKRTRRIEKGERTVSYAKFEKILREHNVHFANHNGNYVDAILHYTEKRRSWYGKEKQFLREKKIANIPFWPGRTVGKNLIKSVRQKAKLTNNHGIDSALFYGTQNTPDDFIQKYKKTLKKLAKT
jgi:death-on-curing protein